MRPQRRSQSAYDGLAEALRAFAARRAQESIGLLLIVLMGLAAVALATWSADDPSFNNATDAAVKNALGRPGAVVADILMQLFGLGAVGRPPGAARALVQTISSIPLRWTSLRDSPLGAFSHAPIWTQARP